MLIAGGCTPAFLLGLTDLDCFFKATHNDRVISEYFEAEVLVIVGSISMLYSDISNITSHIA